MKSWGRDGGGTEDHGRGAHSPFRNSAGEQARNASYQQHAVLGYVLGLREELLPRTARSVSQSSVKLQCKDTRERNLPNSLGLGLAPHPTT